MQTQWHLPHWGSFPPCLLNLPVLNAMLGVLYENILKQIPSIIKSALSKHNIHSRTISYAICLCHCTYTPIYTKRSSILTYLQYCTNMVILKSQYEESLLESLSGIRNHPKKTFIYHDFNNYLRTLLIQGDIETAVDNSCNNLFTLHTFPF